MSEAPPVTDAGRLSSEAAGVLVAELYDRHGRAVLGLCRLLLRDAEDAEDATQSAFLAAYGALLRGTVPRNGSAWITTIARNECRARIRDRMRAPVTADEQALLAVPAVGADPSQRVRDDAVQKALAALPERQRHAVLLHDVFGLRAREVATALGVSLTAVEALVFRARRQLHVRLRPVTGALSLPIGLRETLAGVIPGFTDGGAASATATGGLGVGLFAKLAASPLAAKMTAAAVAVTATGSVVAVETSRPERPQVRQSVSLPASVDRSADRGDSRRRDPADDDRRAGENGSRSASNSVLIRQAEDDGLSGNDDRVDHAAGNEQEESTRSGHDHASARARSDPSGRDTERPHDDASGARSPESSDSDDSSVHDDEDDSEPSSSSGSGSAGSESEPDDGHDDELDDDGHDEDEPRRG